MKENLEKFVRNVINKENVKAQEELEKIIQDKCKNRIKAVLED